MFPEPVDRAFGDVMLERAARRRGITVDALRAELRGIRSESSRTENARTLASRGTEATGRRATR